MISADTYNVRTIKEVGGGREGVWFNFKKMVPLIFCYKIDINDIEISK